MPSLMRLRPTLSPRLLSTVPRRLASSDYGSPGHKSDPAAKGTSQPNPSADKEHPGPAPPKAGQGTGGATKADEKGHVGTEKQRDFKPTGQQRQLHTYARLRPGARGGSGTVDAVGGGRGGFVTTAWRSADKESKPRPKIHNPEKPTEDAEAKKHNEEFDKSRERQKNGKEGEKLDAGTEKGKK